MLRHFRYSFLLRSDPSSPSFFSLDTTSDYEQEGCKTTQDVWLAMIIAIPCWEKARLVITTDIQAKKQTSTLCEFSPPAISPKVISKLQQHEIEAYINELFKKLGDLLTGYKVALNSFEWEKPKAEKAEASASEDVIDEVENEEKPKKQKRDSEGSTSVRKRKTSTASDAKKKVPPKGKKGGKKKENAESEDDGKADEGVGTSKKGMSPPPAKKGRRDKEEHDEGDVANDPEVLKVHEWRHRLQKTFLSNKGDPKERWISYSVKSRLTSLSPHITSRKALSTIFYLHRGSSLRATVNSVFVSALFRFFCMTGS
ncbi:uncharacterized protein ARMOST_10130 [Armillaria ostoyae]|uniref:Uncharacterized protein n=1 Tax=Armillaria ostoyae TaxID=47428 RepID=A0A284RDJ4_ARMOS|nr:uncharacterized protein ARMOST_10130 [Armillaria ostoyae]